MSKRDDLEMALYRLDNAARHLTMRLEGDDATQDADAEAIGVIRKAADRVSHTLARKAWWR